MARKDSRTLDELSIKTISGLAMDAVERAQSGHPGLPMGAGAMAYVLWTRHLQHNPADPAWPDRDRFVLSAGHGSMLIYALLHLTGYDLSLEEIKNFRQWGSKTAGHPEHGLTPGVEATTGPLGQGFGNAVGMAIAQRWLAATFNRPGHEIVDHYTYVLASDGDLMEGVQSEAASLAGHLGLGRLIVLYDDNRISIDGSTDLAFTEDRGRRFEAYGWHMQRVDGHDLESVDTAIAAAQRATEAPSIIVARTHIGYGAPNKQDTASAHGTALGPDEVRLAKETLGIPADAEFWIPDEVRDHMGAAVERGRALQLAWEGRLAAYAEAYPDLANIFGSAIAGELPAGWDEALPSFEPGQNMATRKASGAILKGVAARIPYLVGGSADLTPSNNTQFDDDESFQRDNPTGRYIHFGVREHAMGAALNGMVLHGGLRPYGGTFLIFSDYMRPSIRLAALTGIPVAYVFTHDSVGLGEDGPTHQPVEHFMALRAIPNLWLVRPADASETVEAWRIALERKDGPIALCLTRQALPVLDRGAKSGIASAEGVARGGYVLAEARKDGRRVTPDVILIGTGSEVHACLEARLLLSEKGLAARVVSLPCFALFDAQPMDYRDEVLPPAVRARLSVEAGISRGWDRYIGDCGESVSLERFGASAPGERNMHEFGFNGENVARRAEVLARRIRTEHAEADLAL